MTREDQPEPGKNQESKKIYDPIVEASQRIVEDAMHDSRSRSTELAFSSEATGVPASTIPSGAPVDTHLTRTEVIGMSLALFISIAFGAVCKVVITVSGNSMLGYEQIASLPMHLLWTYSVLRVGQLLSARYRKPLPLGLGWLFLISVAAFTTMPLFGPNHLTFKWLDPIFWCWVLTQVSVPFTFASYVALNDSKGGFGGLFPVFVSLASISYLLLGLVVPDLLANETYFSICWFICQVMVLKYFAILSSRFLDRTRSKVTRRTRKFTGQDIELAYRHYAEVERWIRQRLKEQNLLRGARLALAWFVGPAAMVVIVALLYNTFFAQAMTAVPASQTVLDASTFSATRAFLLAFLFGLVALVLGAMIAPMLKPTSVRFGASGITMVWKHELNRRESATMPWSRIEKIYIEQKDRSPHIVFLPGKEDSMKPLKLKLSSFESYEDREMILKAIQAWGPTIERHPEVIRALEPPADHSYTELWLEALTAPPKRDKLKPLVEGAVLKSGAYRVIGSLGGGGQGQAYSAVDTMTGDSVVLKEFILPVFVDVSVRKSSLEQFENEARILNKLDNRKVVKLMDYFVEDHRAYLILEHISGKSLRQLVKEQGALDEARVVSLAAQMCDILEYLHGLTPPVVHRDFTPDNLILNEDGILKLIDFNVAQQVESTTTGTVVGKQAYLPPEQFRGMPSSQSDLYAMGATLFYLLTGTDPEPISVSIPSQHEGCTVSQQLDNLVSCCTALDTSDRAETIADVREMLSR